MTTKTLMHVKTDDILATFVCVFDVYYFLFFLEKRIGGSLLLSLYNKLMIIFNLEIWSHCFFSFSFFCPSQT